MNLYSSMDRLETRINNIRHLQIIYLYSSMDRLETPFWFSKKIDENVFIFQYG